MPAPKRNKAVVLLSSGLDSSVNLALACQKMDVVLALTFDYGQMAAAQEIASAKALCQHFQIPHKIVDLKWFNDFSHSALNQKQDLPVDQDISLEDGEISKKSAATVWVPNRNGIFLNIAAGYAEGLQAEWVVPGFNKEEASTFPDNSEAFMKALDTSFEFSTNARVKVKCLTVQLNKAEIVALGKKAKLDFTKLWPCYQNQKHWCGACESCQRFKRALQSQGFSFEDLRLRSGGQNAL